MASQCLTLLHKVCRLHFAPQCDEFPVLTASSESLIKSVYKNAGIDPRDTGYVEAHGTGTKVGDPIEASVLHRVFCEGRSARNPLFIGSVKSNIGHLEAASGENTLGMCGPIGGGLFNDLV